MKRKDEAPSSRSPDPDALFSDLPHVADGLTRQERAVLVALAALEAERPERPVAAAAIYGRVVEHVPLSVPAFERLLAAMSGRGLIRRGVDAPDAPDAPGAADPTRLP